MKRWMKRALPMETIRKSNLKYENIETFVIGGEPTLWTKFLIETQIRTRISNNLHYQRFKGNNMYLYFPLYFDKSSFFRWISWENKQKLQRSFEKICFIFHTRLHCWGLYLLLLFHLMKHSTFLKLEIYTLWNNLAKYSKIFHIFGICNPCT